MFTRTSQDIRKRNRFAVLRSVYSNQTVTRALIAQETGLSSATASTLIAELVERGVVEESGLAASSGGRPKAVFRPAAGRGLLIGIDLAETYLRAEVFDLALGSREQTRLSFENESMTPREVVAAVERAVGLLRTACPSDEIIGVGVSLPGQVDPVRGVSVFAPNWDWRDVPVRNQLAQRLSLPVHVDNPLRAVAINQLWFGVGRIYRDFITVNLGTGVGAGIVVDGSLLRGQGNAAGEWGHTTLVHGGRRCRCGRRGCVESYVGVPGLRTTLSEISPDHPLLGPTDQTSFVARLSEACTDGDAGAAMTLERTGRYLAASLGNLVNLFNPEHIHVTGWLTRYTGTELLDTISRAIDAEALPGPLADVTITVGSGTDSGVTRGMAVIALEHFLDGLGLPASADRAQQARPASGGETARTITVTTTRR